MDRITSMAVFDKVVEAGSFTGAARQLRLSQAAVSKHVAGLEAWLGARLFNRTTRRISLTDFGRAFHQRCVRVLEDLEEARQAAGAWRTVPRGALRVTAPIPFSRQLEPVLADFGRRYPEVELEMVLTDRRIDLIEEGCDVAIRVGHLPDSSLTARLLAVSPYFVCAAPSYLARHGTPGHPDELLQHDCLLFAHHTHGHWRFSSDAGEIAVPVKGRLVSNNADLLLAAVLDGQGIMLAPAFHVGDGLRTGRLVPLLEPYMRDTSVIHAVYPQTRHLSAKVRCFIDCLVPWFKAEPWTMAAGSRSAA
jgi:DNA-binding transcriptional LysR family regulator